MLTQTLKPFANTPTQPRRAAGGFIVIGLHVALVATLIYGLKVTLTPNPEHVLQARVISPPTDIEVKPFVPHPPTIDTTVHLQAPVVIIDETPDHPTAPVNVSAQNGNGTQALASADPRGIASTHTIPPYPPISIRLNETGLVTLQVVIAADGTVADARLVKSSGYERLDTAAVSWVKAHWRYRPAVQDGRPVPSTTTAIVKFELTNR